jgi:2-dehydro-3-deoxyphosphooctonate aldolase (KDO 8-P synthase)
MDTVCTALKKLSEELGFDYVFKASFDKANRTSLDGTRGPGIEQALGWFKDLKAKHQVKTLTDVHETQQVAAVAKVIDVLQIPAFLCRQTDLVAEAAGTGRTVNIKKGQFLAPAAMSHIVEKARAAAKKKGIDSDVLVTERGVSFGYGNLVVDMRAFPIMAKAKAPLILDITHSTQLPAGGEGGKTSGAERVFAPVLARAATATGYLSGYFLEVHTDPPSAISDKDAQLTIKQAEALLRQLVPLWHASKDFAKLDAQFEG